MLLSIHNAIDSTVIGSDIVDEANTLQCEDPYRDCNGHGFCFDDFKSDAFRSGCHCFDGFATFHPRIAGTQCNYARKNQSTAFLLSLFLGVFGAGRFYVGRWLTATMKCIGALAISAGCSAGCYAMALPEMSAAVVCCYVITVVVWWIVDIILFACNAVSDGNGVQLAPW